MGLRFVGIADDIVLLAFGLGGRDAAGKVAQRWADKVTKPTDRV